MATDTPLIRGTHVHEWGEVEQARFTGNPYRPCKGCHQITLDLDEDEDEDTLGPCGCVDYHYADCDTRTGAISYDDDPYENERW